MTLWYSMRRISLRWDQYDPIDGGKTVLSEQFKFFTYAGEQFITSNGNESSKIVSPWKLRSYLPISAQAAWPDVNVNFRALVSPRILAQLS